MRGFCDPVRCFNPCRRTNMQACRSEMGARHYSATTGWSVQKEGACRTSKTI